MLARQPLERALRPLLHGGTGVAAATLAPRAASFGVQWLLTLAAGPAAVAAYVTITSRATVIVSLVAAGLAPTLLRRRSAFASPAGRALIGSALAVLAATAFLAMLAFESTVGLGVTGGVAVAAFSACSLFASVATAVWPVWQIQGRYLQSLAALLLISPIASSGAALWGRPAITCLATGLASATPGLLLVRPARIRVRRAIHYATILIRRAVPLSITNFATAIVFPTAIAAGVTVLGSHRVGQQSLYWSCAVVLSIASQSFASRALSGRDAGAAYRVGSADAGALRAWLPRALALCLVAATVFGLFAVHVPGIPWTGKASEAMAPTLLVSGIAPLLTDPLCFYFSGQKGARLLAAGSVACSALVAACLLTFPVPVMRHFGVIGPSAAIGVLRLAFVTDATARRPARVTMAALLAAYAIAAWR